MNHQTTAETDDSMEILLMGLLRVLERLHVPTDNAAKREGKRLSEREN